MPTRLETAQLVGGRFRLLREIGRGSAGAVWHVRNETTERDFALKVLHVEAAHDPIALRRFVNEARAAGRLQHPNVVEVFDTGMLEDGTPYQVMELLEGESLGARLRREGSLSVVDALQITRDVARGLAAAHRRGIVHRDVKPENVLLSTGLPSTGLLGTGLLGNEEGAVVPKLLDFGVSKLDDTAGDPLATRHGALMGSPAYMSPEQIASAADVDARSDVWSLGVVLYRCLAGRVPFAQRELRELAFAIASTPAPPLASLRPDVPPAVVALVDRCMAKSREARFPTADALADALTELLARPLDGPECVGSAAGRPGRRRRVVHLAVASAAVAAFTSALLLVPVHRDPPPRAAAPAAPAAPVEGAVPTPSIAPITTSLVEVTPPRIETRAPASPPHPRTRGASAAPSQARRPHHEGVVEPGF